MNLTVIGRAIKWATSTKESPTLWNHDAIIVNQRGHLCIGDALLGRDCQLTVFWEWEQGCRKHGHKLIVLRPANATADDGERTGTARLLVDASGQIIVVTNTASPQRTAAVQIAEFKAKRDAASAKLAKAKAEANGQLQKRIENIEAMLGIRE